jgi:hypothetical protein
LSLAAVLETINLEPASPAERQGREEPAAKPIAWAEVPLANGEAASESSPPSAFTDWRSYVRFA